jgi:hypothetical protein
LKAIQDQPANGQYGMLIFPNWQKVWLYSHCTFDLTTESGCAAAIFLALIIFELLLYQSASTYR